MTPLIFLRRFVSIGVLACATAWPAMGHSAPCTAPITTTCVDAMIDDALAPDRPIPERGAFADTVLLFLDPGTDQARMTALLAQYSDQISVTRLKSAARDLSASGQTVEARQAFAAALAQLETPPFKRTTPIDMVMLASAEGEAGFRDDARETLRRASAAARQGGDPGFLTHQLRQIAMTQRAQGWPEDAPITVEGLVELLPDRADAFGSQPRLSAMGLQLSLWSLTGQQDKADKVAQILQMIVHDPRYPQRQHREAVEALMLGLAQAGRIEAANTFASEFGLSDAQVSGLLSDALQMVLAEAEFLPQLPPDVLGRAQTLIAAQPELRRADTMRGMLITRLAKAGDIATAETLQDQMSTPGPRREALYDLAQPMARDFDDPEGAARLLAKAAPLPPASPRYALTLIAQAYLDAGNTAAARPFATQALELALSEAEAKPGQARIGLWGPVAAVAQISGAASVLPQIDAIADPVTRLELLQAAIIGAAKNGGGDEARAVMQHMQAVLDTIPDVVDPRLAELVAQGHEIPTQRDLAAQTVQDSWVAVADTDIAAGDLAAAGQVIAKMAITEGNVYSVLRLSHGLRETGQGDAADALETRVLQAYDAVAAPKAQGLFVGRLLKILRQ